MRMPPGPDETCSTTQDLLSWMVRQRERYGDIYKASIDGFGVYVVSDPEYARHVLRTNWQNYTKGFAIKRVAFLLGNGLMVSEGELWQSQRRMIQPAFHRNAVAALAGVMAAANQTLLEKWSDAARGAERVNVTRDISVMVLEVVLAAIFGGDVRQAMPDFQLLSDEPARDLKFAQSFRSLGKTVLRVVAERRGRKIEAAGILGMLMAARDRPGHAMPDGRLVNEVLTLIVAGHETTASVLNWAWYLLSQHKEVEERLSRELDQLPDSETLEFDDLPNFTYTRQVLEEVLRLYPPGWLLTRKAIGDDRLGDYVVPAGTEIFISPYLIQRNPGLWPEPDRFNPDRFAPEGPQDHHPLAMLPFSAGPRNCIGEVFARLEMQIHLMTIARRLRLHYADDRPPEVDSGVNLRSRNDFLMIPEIK